MDKIDKWLTIDELAGYIKMSRTKLYGMALREVDRARNVKLFAPELKAVPSKVIYDTIPATDALDSGGER